MDLEFDYGTGVGRSLLDETREYCKEVKGPDKVGEVTVGDWEDRSPLYLVPLQYSI